MKLLRISILLVVPFLALTNCHRVEWDKDYYSYGVGFRMDGKEYHKGKNISMYNALSAFSNDTILICRAGVTDIQDARFHYSDLHSLFIEAIFDSLIFQNGRRYEITDTDDPLPGYVLTYYDIQTLFDSFSGRQSILQPYILRIIFNYGNYSVGWIVTGGWVSYEFDEPLQKKGHLYGNYDIPEYMIKKIEFEFEAEDEKGVTHHITDGYIKGYGNSR